MVCQVNEKRPCSSKSRSSNRYQRKELEPIAKDCGLKKIKTASIDDLCTGIIESMKKELQKDDPKDTKQKCGDDRIYNPVTKRCVKIRGKTAKTLLADHVQGKVTLSPADLHKIKQLIDKSVFDQKNISEIIDTEKEIIMKPDSAKVAIPPKPLTILNFAPSPPKNPADIMHAKFKEYFSDELLGFFGKTKPRFRMITSGGYGFKQLVEIKHGMYGRVQTADMDLTVSTYESSMNPLSAYTHWMVKINKFIYSQPNPQDFKIKTINFNNEFVPIMHFHRYYVIMLMYKDEDFVDVAITNMKIHDYMIDIPTSLKAGIPIKNEEYYLKEFLSLIYMENVPGVNYYCYAKRNPVTGSYSCKGAKDIDRSKLICELEVQNKFSKYCELLRDITVAKLRSMSQYKRDKYFISLQELINIKTPFKS